MKKRVVSLLIIFIFLSLILESYFAYSKIYKVEETETNYINIPEKILWEIVNFNVINKEIYLAIDGSEYINYNLDVIGKLEETVSFISENEDIATVDDNGKVIGKNIGSTTIKVTIADKVQEVIVTVTNLIEVIPNEYNTKKKLLTCNQYTEEQNDLLDKILENRVSEAGLKTRAGVVAAARFITLEFPYKIGYFSENGRVTTYGYTNYVDGEGRYYHKGLYLHKSRFTNIKRSMYGPNTWGCGIYSYVSEGIRRNGFDCSGFIAWILLNGGFDSGDIGAGISNIITDMTDLGTKINLKTSIQNNNIKVGDLLSGPKSTGGHIAMVVGIKDNNYYVAECLWGNGYYGAIIRTYSQDNLTNYFYWHIDMDVYYQEDGNYTEYWI